MFLYTHSAPRKSFEAQGQHVGEHNYSPFGAQASKSVNVQNAVGAQASESVNTQNAAVNLEVHKKRL